MRCPNCAASIDDDSRSCPRCGRPVQPSDHSVRLTFIGAGVELLGWMLVMIAACIAFIVPGAWAFAAMCRWFCRNLRTSAGEAIEFLGTGEQVVGWWLLSLLNGSFPSREFQPGWMGVHIRVIDINGYWWITLPLFLVGCYGTLQVIRWFVRNVRLGGTAGFQFTGEYWELLGYQLLNALLVLTVIGWAWSLAAMYRWMARNTRSTDRVLRFHGEGHQVLWRLVVTILMSLPVLTIPWAFLWYTRWVVANTTVEGQPV